MDDEKHVLMTLQAILQEDGYRVDTSADGTQAIEAIRANHYDLVLTDLKMPGIDGLGVLAEVQKCSPGTVTLMMTGYGSVDSALEAVQLGAYEYLRKPMEVPELKQAVRRSLERKRLSQVDTLYRVSSAVSASFDRNTIAHEIEDAAQQVLGLNSTHILTFPPENLRATFPGLSQLVEQEVVRTALEQGLAITDEDCSAELKHLAGNMGMSSFALVPGIANGTLVCALFLHNGAEKYEFHASALRFLRALAGQCALALSNAHLFARLQQNNLELESANRRLLELDRLRSQFLSVATHELRTPLTIIMGYNSMLADSLSGRVSHEENELLSESVNACQRLIRMVNTMLDLTQIEAGKLRIEFSSTNAPSLVKNIVGLFQTEASKRDIQLTVDVPEVMPLLLLDGDRIEQVITNLVGNALKFTDSGGGIRVSLLYRADAETFEIEVSDNGIGIAPEDQEHIFDEFAQLEKQAAKRHREGTGLGLAIAKRIVQAHSGTISVRSAPGSGSTFTVRLPARRAKATTSAILA